MTTTQKQEITAESFRAALVKAVETKGENYLYPRYLTDDEGRVKYDANDDPIPNPEYSDADSSGSCQYRLRDGVTPGCIIGFALAELGYLDDLPSFGDNTGAHELLGWSVFGPVPVAVVEAASAAQSAQDSGSVWGDALREFDRTLAVNS